MSICPSARAGKGCAISSRKRIGIGVDLDQAVAADRRQQMKRGDQPDAAAEPMRAEANARRERLAADVETAGKAAPFAQVGLQHLDPAGGDGSIELLAAHVLAGRQRHRRNLRQRLPLFGRGIGAQRLFQPHRPERRDRLAHGGGRLEIPALIGVHHQSRIVPECRAQRREVGEIALMAEADLELEGAVALACLGRGKLFRPIGIEAAGIDRQPADGLAGAEVTIERLARDTRGQVPQRHIDAGQALRDRSRLAALDRQHRKLLARAPPNLAGRRETAPDQQRRHRCADKPRAMFRADRGEIAPDFAPSFRALRIGGAHQHGGPAVHGAEGGAHGIGDRHAKDARLDGGNRDLSGGRHGVVNLDPGQAVCV